MTDAEKKELEALMAKADLTDEEKTRLEALKKKEADADKTFSEDYVKGLRSENAKYRTKAKEAAELLAKFEGIDPEKYREMVEAQKQAEKDKLEKKGEWEKLREQLVNEHIKQGEKWEKEKAALMAQYQALEAELDGIILSNEIAVAATVAKAINPKLVEMVAKTMTKVEKTEDGKRVIKVLDTDGEERMDLKTGKPYSIAQLLENMKEDEAYAHLFSGGKVGAGSNTTRFDGKDVANPWKRESLNLTLQGKIIKENPALAERLKAEAGVV